jgi:hypothetical protein
VHLGYIAGPRAVLYSFSRRHLRHVLRRPIRRERPVPRLHGLGDALVLRPGLGRHPLGWTPGGHDAIVCYLRQGSNVIEAYWTTRCGVGAMDDRHALLDMTVYGRQETWEDSPTGWPLQWEANAECFRTNGRPTTQWSRLEAGGSDNLDTTPARGRQSDGTVTRGGGVDCQPAPSTPVRPAFAELNEQFVRHPSNVAWQRPSSTPTTRAQSWSATRAWSCSVGRQGRAAYPFRENPPCNARGEQADADISTTLEAPAGTGPRPRSKVESACSSTVQILRHSDE